MRPLDFSVAKSLCGQCQSGHKALTTLHRIIPLSNLLKVGRGGLVCIEAFWCPSKLHLPTPIMHDECILHLEVIGDPGTVRIHRMCEPKDVGHKSWVIPYFPLEPQYLTM